MVFLDDSTFTVIQRQSHYPVYRDKLMDIDRKRFRGLGEDNLRLFITHGTKYCLDARLPTVRDTAYVMYMMSMIGSYFFEDARYLHIHRILQDYAADNPARFNRVSRVFSEFMSRYAGENGERFRTALTVYRDRVESLPDTVPHEEIVRIWARCVGIENPRNVEALQRVFPDHARHAARYLGVSSEDGERICLSLSLWLGTGFYKDPLYPWIRDIPSKEISERARTTALMKYTKKRLDHQLNALRSEPGDV